MRDELASWSAVAEQMREHASSRSCRLRQPDRERGTNGNRVRQVAQAMEEQFKDDQQELETREKKRKVEDVKRIRRSVRESNKNQDLSHVQSEMGKLMHHDEQELLSRSCAPRPGEREWSTSVATRCTQGSLEKRAHVKREGHPSRQDGRRPTRGNQGSPNVRKRWVAKEYKTHARPELYASIPPLEALKIVLSKTATGKRGGKVVALIDVCRTAARRSPAG